MIVLDTNVLSALMQSQDYYRAACQLLGHMRSSFYIESDVAIHSTISISPGRQVLLKNGSSGL